jgi:hypothetical protein
MDNIILVPMSLVETCCLLVKEERKALFWAKYYMSFDKVKKYLPYVWTGAPVLAALISLIVGLVNKNAAIKIMLVISSVLLVAMGVLIYIYFFVLCEFRRNYFLTDMETGRNKRRSELTFEHINNQMNFFMAKRIYDESELWLGGFLGKRGMFGVGDVFKPLAVYKMLYDLGERNEYEGWRMFYDMPDSDFARMINCLESVNDLNMSRKLTALRSVNDGTATDRLSDFIIGNQKYIRNRMITYVVDNIDKFDEPKK